MRYTITALTVLLLASSVHADDRLAHTRAVLERHASGVRRTRVVGATVLVGAGIATGVAGFYVAGNASGWFADLERGFGYSLVVVGGLAITNGALLLFTQSEQARLRDEVSDEQDARFARVEIADKAEKARRDRRIVRVIGLTLTGIGAVGVGIPLAIPNKLERDTKNEMLGSGIAFGAFGAAFLVGSLVESRWQTMHRELQAPPPTTMIPAIVPVRDGALAGLSVTF